MYSGLMLDSWADALFLTALFTHFSTFNTVVVSTFVLRDL